MLASGPIGERLAAPIPKAMTTVDRPQSPCTVTIIIKALNEEKRIKAAAESALVAVRGIGGEVVLADSCSSDSTVTLARAFPIRIVQLAEAAERCCGVGPELGYQHALGEFLYILDGDMEMLPDFLPAALDFMQAHPEVAGVGGRVVEMNTTSLEFVARAERDRASSPAGEIDRLDMGGLYRRSAVEQVGYLSNRNLHSYEELDLAVRLRVKGWKLWRIDIDAVRHYGHDAPPYRLLMQRWRSRYICGLGEMLRAAWGQPHLPLVLSDVRQLRLYLAVVLWWAGLVAMLFLPASWDLKASAFALLAAAPFLLMVWRKRSASRAAYSVISWCFHTVGLLRGLLTPQRPARATVGSVQIQNIG